MKIHHPTSLVLLGSVLSCVNPVSAGADMIIDFPGLLRPRASNDKVVLAASSANLLAFSSALGGAVAEPVTSTGDSTRPFAVDAETFTDFQTAAGRSCNNQHNACADVAHGDNANGLTVGECDTQQTQCQSAAQSGPSTSGSSGSSSSSINNQNSVAAAAATIQQSSSSTSTSSTSTSTSSTLISIAAAASTSLVVQSSVVATSASAAVVVSTSTSSAFQVQGTLHSSDENFFYFCD